MSNNNKKNIIETSNKEANVKRRRNVANSSNKLINKKSIKGSNIKKVNTIKLNTKKSNTKKRYNKKRHNKIKFVVVISLIIIVAIVLFTIILSRKNENEKEVEVAAVMNIEDDKEQYKSIYENVYEYDIKNEQRYINYKSKNSDLIVEDIVWRTNAGLDKGFYTDITEIKVTDDILLLVNKYNKLPDDYVPENLEKLPSGQYLEHNTKIAFEKMKKDAKNKKYIINDVSGYRSISIQKELYNSYSASDTQEVSDTYSARSGHSEHHTGQAIDISGSFGSILEFGETKESKWIEDNAYKYGFIIRYLKGYENITGYNPEPWHIRYVGIEVATDMKEKNIHTLEEYFEKFILHKPIL